MIFFVLIRCDATKNISCLKKIPVKWNFIYWKKNTLKSAEKIFSFNRMSISAILIIWRLRDLWWFVTLSYKFLSWFFLIFRYVLIGYYANYRKIYTKLNIAIMIISVWFFSFGMMIPPLADVWGTLGLDESTFSCTILRYYFCISIYFHQI